MAESPRYLHQDAIITGWDFSTGAVKCLAFDLGGNVLVDVRLPTDLWTEDGVAELNLMQLEGQAYASTRGIANQLLELNRLHHWLAGGISATHHTAGRIDSDKLQVRRAICWNDHTLAAYHKRGLERLGGQEKVRGHIGGPWAIRYSLRHLVKDEVHLSKEDWTRTYKIGTHGVLAAGYLTGNFDVTSVSSAASTGVMNLRTNTWCRGMLEALESTEYRELAWAQLPRIVDQSEPVGRLRRGLAEDLGVTPDAAPFVFPTSDDQQAGLIGGGAVDAGQMAIILGNSAVVNSSAMEPPQTDSLDSMKLNWGPYLWMRCYNNGAQFLDRVVGETPNWKFLETEARKCPAGANEHFVLPFIAPEPSLGVKTAQLKWIPTQPADIGMQFRVSLEAIAYLIALGVRAHEENGQQISRITVSGGIAKSELMCEILATVLNRRLERLQSDEGPALGAAVTALAALETHLRRQDGVDDPFTVAHAVTTMVQFGEPVDPNPQWGAAYEHGFRQFEDKLKMLG
ncbi:MAG: FGGY-family carbohydrate kinase [Gemmataceae bacterium]